MTDTDTPRWTVEDFDPEDTAPPGTDPYDAAAEEGGDCTGHTDGELPDVDATEGMEGVALPADAHGLLRGLPDPRDPDTIVRDREDPRMADSEDDTPLEPEPEEDV